MEQIPFDGLVVDLDVNGGPDHTGTRFAWQVWSPTVLDEADYSLAIHALQNTPFRRFTDNFLHFHVTPGSVDWFDPTFAGVLANAELAGRIVKACGLRGLFVDVEQYRGKLFYYAAQPEAALHTFADYQQQVRLRGQEFMRAVRAGYQHAMLVLTYGYYLGRRPSTLGRTLETAQYGLLPSFLDGMLDVIAPPQLLYDGWEYAYGYTAADQFRTAYDLMHQKCQDWYAPNIQVKFRQHYRASFGLWIDRDGVWDQTDFTNNYFTPEEFEASLRLALRYTDRYVWIYNQKANWWDGQVPQPYIDALTRARVV
jgi:hypothetical protein